MLVCNKLLPYFQNMSIDEAKQYSLTNFQAKGPKKQAIKSDNNLLKAVFDINFKKAKADYR